MTGIEGLVTHLKAAGLHGLDNQLRFSSLVLGKPVASLDDLDTYQRAKIIRATREAIAGFGGTPPPPEDPAA